MVIGCGNTTGGAFNRWAANGTAKSGAASPAGSPTSPARPWSCAAPSERLSDPARGIDAANRVVLGTDHQDVAAGVESEFLGRVEDGILRRAAVAAVAARPGAGDCIDDPGAGIDGAQRAALPLENIDRAVGRDLDRAGAEHAGTA